jgi:uncharacterized Zn finger protein (UPF0148 family)
VHFSARDLEDAMLELHGLKAPEKDKGLAKLIECPRCGTTNPFGSVRCSLCGMVMEKDAALKLEQDEQEKREKLEKKNQELQTRLEKLETVISSLLASPAAASNVH